MKDPELLAWQMRERAKQLPEREVVYERIYEPSEEQKKIYYHAGRWAAGAKDYTARLAFLEFERLEQL